MRWGAYVGSSGTAGAPDLQGSFNSLGHNLIGKKNGSIGFTDGVNGDLAGSQNVPVDPLLGPLSDNGGPTFTMSLLHESPALDAADSIVLKPPYALRKDQRGFPRKSGSRVDIGAFEFRYHNRGDYSSAPELTLSRILSPSDNLQLHEPYKSYGSGTPTGVQLTFSDNTPGATFTILTTTNISLPYTEWSVLGQPIQIHPGLFQYTDIEAFSKSQLFYCVSSP